MLIPDLLFLKCFFIFFVIDLLENVLESTVIAFQDSVLGGEVERILSVEGILEALFSELCYALVSVVHGYSYTS